MTNQSITDDTEAERSYNNFYDKSVFVCYTMSSSSSSSSLVVCILTERSCVDDAAAGDAVLSTPPGHVEVKVQCSKVLLYSPQSGGSQPTRQTFLFIGWDKFLKQ